MIGRASDAKGERFVEDLVVPRRLVVRVQQDVRVGVDQPREDRRAGKVDDARVSGRSDLRRGPSALDLLPADEHCPSLVHVGAIEDARGAEKDRGRRSCGGLLRRGSARGNGGGGDRGEGDVAPDDRSKHE
jgi:hypothetical protein